MQVQVIASGSASNCYALRAAGSILLLEAGVRMQTVRRALGADMERIVGALISHEHQDHARSAADLTRAAVDVYASAGTLAALHMTDGHRAHALKGLVAVQLPGPWRVRPFGVPHDAAEPFGFAVSDGAGDKLLYLTDAGYSPHRLATGFTHLMIEANYGEELLRKSQAKGQIPGALKQRILREHMSIERVLELLRVNDLSAVREIWLLHLSDDRSDAEDFRRQVQEETGKPVYVADRGVA